MIAAALFLAGSQAATAMSPDAITRRVIAAPAKPVVTGPLTCVPLTLSDGHAIIPVTLAGQTLRLIFDTGSPGGPHIDSAIIDKLNLTKIGEVRMTDPSMQNIQTIGLYQLRDLKIGNLTIHDWNVSGSPPSPNLANKPDGVIGLDAFSGYVVTIDYPGGRVVATPGRLPEPDGKTSFRYQGPIPLVPLTIEGQPIDAHVDTGNARYALILPQSYAAHLAGYSNRFPIGVAHTINNQYNLMALPVRDAKVGNLPLYAGTAAFPAPATIGNIGAPLLRDFVIKVDPANSIISLERATPALEPGCSNP
jgi:hypothetical protein